jgi:hypothetical protein
MIIAVAEDATEPQASACATYVVAQGLGNQRVAAAAR